MAALAWAQCGDRARAVRTAKWYGVPALALVVYQLFLSLSGPKHLQFIIAAVFAVRLHRDQKELWARFQPVGVQRRRWWTATLCVGLALVPIVIFVLVVDYF